MGVIEPYGRSVFILAVWGLFTTISFSSIDNFLSLVLGNELFFDLLIFLNLSLYFLSLLASPINRILIVFSNIFCLSS